MKEESVYELKPAAVFSNHMVLQRDKNIRIFGECPCNSSVTVLLQKGTDTVKVDASVDKHHFLAVLPPQSAGDGFEMQLICTKADGQQTIRSYTDVSIGEVWLAGGQSNMEFELQNCTGGSEMLQNDRNPNVRFYYTQKNATMDEHFYQAEANSGWSVFDSEQAKAWSAVGYLCGKRLAKELHVTVGIIGCNWGGTSASAWMSRERLQRDAELKTYLDEYDEVNRTKTIEEQKKEWEDYISYSDLWNQRCAEFYEKNPKAAWEDCLQACGECKWPGPKNSFNPYRPAGLYECMLKRVMPYTLRGFLYYQGESDDHKPNLYYRLFTQMIEEWREGWGDLTLPFLFVQLPMHRYIADPDYKNWCIIRQAQMDTYQTIKNTGIAVILDCGEYNEIHPKDKAPVGERLALQALYHVYHRISEDEAFGPILSDVTYEPSGLTLHFLYAKDGFDIKSATSEFEIAGADMEYVPADFKLLGDTIYVSSEQVKNPMHVRYCYTNYGDVPLFGKNGLPLAPFFV